jgi:hypothetical protein
VGERVRNNQLGSLVNILADFLDMPRVLPELLRVILLAKVIGLLLLQELLNHQHTSSQQESPGCETGEMCGQHTYI